MPHLHKRLFYRRKRWGFKIKSKYDEKKIIPFVYCFFSFVYR